MERKSAVIFDLDGVLWRSSAAHEKAYREAFESIGIRAFSYRRFAGVRTDEVVDTVASENNVPLSAAERARIIDRKRKLARVYLETETAVDPIVVQVISFLSPHYRMAIATSASQRTLGIFLNKSGLGSHFSALLSGEDVSQGKPDPEIYLLASQRLGLPPAATWTVEDAVEGIRSGKTAGSTVVGVTGLYSSEELLEAGAAYVVADIGELRELFMP